MTVDPLELILERKRKDVAARREHVPLEDMRRRALEADRPRNFFKVVTQKESEHHSAVIAEIKRKSPVGGWFRDAYRSDEGFDACAIAKAYHAAGATAISCATDPVLHGGSIEMIRPIRNRVPLPVLRNDFIIDPWQIYESRAAAADAVLLHADALTEGQLVDLLILSTELRMTSIIEVRSIESLLKVRPHIGFPHPGYVLLGINNRHVETRPANLNQTFRMVDLVEDRSILVSNAGITDAQDLTRLRENGVRIVMVGDTLMSSDDPGAALKALLDGSQDASSE